MKAYIVGNNLTMIAGMHGGQTIYHSTCGSYVPSSAYGAGLQLLYAVQEALKNRLINEQGTILMIMPVNYSGAKSLLHMGFKPTFEGKNPNSGNKCYHFVESVESVIQITRAFLQRKIDEFGMKERTVTFGTFVSVNSGRDLMKDSLEMIKFCDDLLSGEDENK